MYTPFRHINSIFLKTKANPSYLLRNHENAIQNARSVHLKSAENKVSAEELSLDEILKVSKSFGSLLWHSHFQAAKIYLRDDLVEISKVFYKNNRPAISFINPMAFFLN